MDVCGAPALTSRVVKQGNVVLIIGAAGKAAPVRGSGSPSGAFKIIGVSPYGRRSALLRDPTATRRTKGAGGMPRTFGPVRRQTVGRRSPPW